MRTSGSVTQRMNLVLTLQAPDGTDLDSLDRTTRSFLSELRDSSHLEDVDLIRDKSIPTGAKSPEAITVGALALAVLPALLPRLVDALMAWSLRWSDYKVRIKRQVGEQSLELEYAPGKTSANDLQRLLALVEQAFPHTEQRSEAQIEEA